jgi:putative transposase
LFEGRFRSSLIEADACRLACQRYIELNPVRASMVRAPGEYPWSSYRANALGKADPLVTQHALYRALADSEEARLAAYRRLFENVLSAELLGRLRDCTNGGFVFGSPRFEQQVAAMVGRRTWRGSPGRPRKQTIVGEQGRWVCEKRGLSLRYPHKNGLGRRAG